MSGGALDRLVACQRRKRGGNITIARWQTQHNTHLVDRECFGRRVRGESLLSSVSARMVVCDRPVLEESCEPCLALGGTCSPL